MAGLGYAHGRAGRANLPVAESPPEPRTLNPASRVPWPKALPEQMRVLRDALAAAPDTSPLAALRRVCLLQRAVGRYRFLSPGAHKAASRGIP